MIQICPKCGGTEVNCPVCGLPPKRKLPTDSIVKKALYKLLPAQVWEVQGIDISAWNGTMNFAITKTKCQYVFVRLGYGNQWKDNRCDTYRRDIIAVDMPYGVYWYAKIGQDYNAHANAFAEIINEFPYQLDVVIDAEETTLDKNGTLSWIMNFYDRLQNLVHGTPMIYTSIGFWDEHVAHSVWTKDIPLWDATWTLGGSPTIPTDWRLADPQWEHWQHDADGNGKGPEYGSGPDGDHDMDLNRYWGSVGTFNLHYNAHIEPLFPPTPPIEPLVPISYVITTGNLNMRDRPGYPLGIDIGTLKLGDDIPVMEEKDGWYRIEGWISKQYTKPK